MIYVGIDLHRKRSQIAALDEQGTELLSRRVANEPEALKAILAELGGELQVALEATYGWEWLADLLEQEGHELHLSHPLRTKAIAAARVKTDAVDARTLAHLLRTDLLPEAYVAPRELRELRDLVRHPVALTRMRSALKQRVGAVMAKHGIARPYSNLFGPGGSRFLAELKLREGPRRRPLHRDARDRRSWRRHALRKRAPPLRLGGAHPDRAKLRRQGPPRPHLRAGIAGTAVGEAGL